MKIGILTFHFASNCGAVLQCLALSEVLKKMGHEVFIIDYRPPYHAQRYKEIKNPFYYGKKAMLTFSHQSVIKKLFRYLKGFAGTIYSWKSYLKQKDINNRFSLFVSKYLYLTERYETLEELQAHPPECDLYISGSDQIWNSKLTDGRLDSAYLLDFGSPKIRRISYAAGVNIEKSDRVLKEYKTLLDQFQTISLRENHYYEQFKSVIKQEIPLRKDLDPTLLLDSSEYLKYMSQEVLEKEPYILIYSMQDDSQKAVYKAAVSLAKRTGVKIIDISNTTPRDQVALIECRNSGPSEFLWYIKHARFVISNSFHSTVFSILFETNFVAIPHSQTGYRITELLDRLALSQCWIVNEEMIMECYNYNVDFSLCKTILNKQKKESIDYLESYMTKG